MKRALREQARAKKKKAVSGAPASGTPASSATAVAAAAAASGAAPAAPAAPAAAAAAAAAAATTATARSSYGNRRGGPLLAALCGAGLFTWFLTMSEQGESIREDISQTDLYQWGVMQWREVSKPFAEPLRQKLLPDWPFLPNTPPGMPCPRTLVIDLEGTLVTSTWNSKHGWRHAKRPGVDEFLKEMARHYEIVIFTTNIGGIADDIITRLDKQGVVMHRLFREHTKYQDGKYIKDLSVMNRDLSRVILLDDDPAAFQLQPENAIYIRPYTNARDKNDSALEDITPFLRAVNNEDVPDVRSLIKAFPANTLESIAQSYNQKIAAVMEKRENAKTRGLGGTLRSMGNSIAGPVADRQDWRIEAGVNLGGRGFGGSGGDGAFDNDGFYFAGAGGGGMDGLPVRSVISETAPPKRAGGGAGALPAERKGKVWQWGASVQARKEEENRKKMEAFGKVMQEKQKAMEEAKSNRTEF